MSTDIMGRKLFGCIGYTIRVSKRCGYTCVAEYLQQALFDTASTIKAIQSAAAQEMYGPRVDGLQAGESLPRRW